MRHRILIVDDEEAVCWSLGRAFAGEGFEIATAANVDQAVREVARKTPHVILLDVRLPGMDGLTALPRLRELANNAPVIIITAFGDLPTVVKSVTEGAFDYLPKPFDLDAAIAAVERALATTSGVPESPAVVGPEIHGPDQLIGRSLAMQDVYKKIALVAPRRASVVITGESGTGKDLVARAIHAHSERRAATFLPIHIAALNPTLLESELFGHVRGAFTGAVENRVGLLALAHGGTVFLDEVAEIPLAAQVKLLRVLDHGEIFPVGSGKPVKVDIRLLAATHQNLQEMVTQGSFRLDLFYRLSVFQIAVPPLRDRLEDIEPLATHFLRQTESTASAIPRETIEYLIAQAWPGNVRELRNTIERAAILARGLPLRPEHFLDPTTPRAAPTPRCDVADRLKQAVFAWTMAQLGDDMADPPTDANNGLYSQALALIEPTLFGTVLERSGHHRWKASRWLGLDRATVRKKLMRYGLDPASDDVGGD